jgi:hypothetical protein
VDEGGAELPDPAESWAWAHAQIAGDVTAAQLPSVLASAPERTLARLVCPRRLEANRRYLACVVPTFSVGVKAGLGQDLTEDDIGPNARLTLAWTPQSGALTLPVYYHWEFATGERGDFEALVGLLERRRFPPEVGMRAMDISAPGPPALAAEATGGVRVLGLEGALTSPSSRRTSWEAVAQAQFQSALRTLLDAAESVTVDDDPGDAVLGPPTYGRWHAARRTVPGPGERPRWLGDLNLDPRERAVAGFGTRVVRDQQEQLMASAWRQVGDVERANALLRQAQLAREVARSVLRRHVEPLRAQSLFLLTGPVHAKVLAGQTTVLARVRRSRLPNAVTAPAYRRVTRPRGPALAPLASATRPGEDLLTRLDAGRLELETVPEAPSGIVTPEAADPGVRGPLVQVATVDAQTLQTTTVRPDFGLQLGDALGIGTVAPTPTIDITPVPGRLGPTPPVFRPDLFRGETPAVPGPSPAVGRFNDHDDHERADASALVAEPELVGERVADTDSIEAFRQALVAHQELVAVEPEPEPAEQSLALEEMPSTLTKALDPERTVVAGVHSRLDVAAIDWEPDDPLEPVMAAPVFPQPTYEALRDLSQELLLPGLEHVPPNSIGLLETNPRFVEAYMVGLNHEMGRELLWRGYPTDQRGTYFSRFWDRTGPAGGGSPARTPPDIPPIHEWDRGVPLGQNLEDADGGFLVLLVRGELLRRYPTATISAARAKLVGGRREIADGTAAEERFPLFRGTLRPDVTFLGFQLREEDARGDGTAAKPGWWFVLQEHPTEPRFGLDETTTVTTPTKPSELAWPHVRTTASGHIDHGRTKAEVTFLSSIGGVPWDGHAADLAELTLQQPVRVAIHASDMLNPGGG